MNEKEKKEFNKLLMDANAANFCKGYIQALDEVMEKKIQAEELGLEGKEIINFIIAEVKSMHYIARETYNGIQNLYPHIEKREIPYEFKKGN